MEVQALRLLLTEQDLSQLAFHAVAENEQVSDIKVTVTPERITVAGTYQMFMRMPFETYWSVAVSGGKLAATLVDMKVVGFAAGLLKGMLIQMIRDEAEKEDAIQVNDETVLVDFDRFLSRAGLSARTNLTVVRCEPGHLILEASSAP